VTIQEVIYKIRRESVFSGKESPQGKLSQRKLLMKRTFGRAERQGVLMKSL
jgi:hypothetical protein